MGFFKKRKSASSDFSTGLPGAGESLPVSLAAHSRFIKRVNCSQCGAPKSLPSKTAYIYCDYCGSLIDYDFRLANADTNAGLTNTVYHRIYATVQAQITEARVRGDREECRRLYRQVYTRWLQECPKAASPRTYWDQEFREQFINYQVECFLTKDFDPRQAELDARMKTLVATLQRNPTPDGAWRVAGPFWEYAALFKQQMEMAYQSIHANGIDALDPDHAPGGVPLRMEYSTFCQGWLPHLSPQEGEKLLKFFGLSGEYDEVRPLPTESRACGVCGSELRILPGARQVVCEACGFLIGVDSSPLACSKCGVQLSLPVSRNQLLCPYCGTKIRRV